MTTSPVVTITEELVAELERFLGFGGKYLKVSSETLRALLAERAAMQSQIKAGILTQDNLELYRKDALRYQWLRNRHNASGDYLCVTDGEDGVIIEDVVGVDGLDLDAAIDQAMREQQP